MDVSERFKLVGVVRPSCAYAIGKSLSKLKYVKDFKSDISTGEAVIAYDSSKISTKDIVKAIRDAGYDVVKNKVVLLTDAEEEEALTIECELRKVIGVIEFTYYQ